jgi:hypothetical protein
MRDSTEQTPQRTTTTEALRQAIAVLGYRAPATEILDYARQHFGIGALAPAAPPVETSREGLAAKPAARRGKTKDRSGE